MEREAFRQRMQQYKQARESNPQLKYWDWKKYAAPDEYKGIKLLQNLFKTDRAFKKRFDQIPLTNIKDNRVIA